MRWSLFFFGSVSVTQWAIYTDTADYGEWKFGRRSTALIMAASLFALKMGLTAGGTIVGWVLEGYGFIANEIQTESTLLGIKNADEYFSCVIRNNWWFSSLVLSNYR